MYVITGATGNTGNTIAHQLLDAGKDVTVVSRDKSHLSDLIEKGATPAVGDLSDTDFLTETFEGAEAVYTMIPPNFTAPDFRTYQHEIADTLSAAIKENSVPHIVALSSCGAHLKQGAGVVQGLHYMEQQFNAIDELHALYLRPAFFMDNFYGQIPLIEEQNIIGFAGEADHPMPMIATRDIADVAARRLLALDFKGKSHHYLLGERDLSFEEATRMLGEVIGKADLNYVRFSYEDAKQGMIAQGASEDLAERYNEFFKALNTGKINEDAVRSPETTTPTSIEKFAKQFATQF
jgi:uncharacterized protein YbjT (DUF2867 family)